MYAELSAAVVALKRAGHSVEWDELEFPGFPLLFRVDGVEITERQLLHRASTAPPSSDQSAGRE